MQDIRHRGEVMRKRIIVLIVIVGVKFETNK